ncbi:GTPase-associated system all-helical protein GASH [Pseudomonas chlororaphis]|uniref:GTPase-associated system all-helical protein GASH n=1 Tax=Pseudomonas chlororaphis TaxID=587753 RepID=UPI002366C415|nr:GTPase-associated system all-helical protein GASH [Pseudomonas chlororaphis]WDH19920.1 GTPase-associated system all-helical protein GASH [Pseudomonas chlororaphis]
MAKHSRIFWTEPQDDQVRRLNQAVTEVQVWMQSLGPAGRAIELAATIARAFEKGTPNDELATIVEKAIVASGSDAFVRQGNDLQITVVAVVSALDLVRKSSIGEDGWGAVDAFAVACWSALSFQRVVEKENLEVLRSELLSAAQERTREVAEKSRERAEVPEVGLLSIPDSTPPNARAKTAFRSAVEPLVKALRENAELDREEIDFLWWRLGDWSGILEKPLSTLSDINRAVVAGLECGTMLRRLPSAGHRNVVLQGVSVEKTFNLAELTDELQAEKSKIVESIDQDKVSSAAEVFPLLYSMVSGNIDFLGSETARSTRDWGGRALLEASVLQLSRRKGS